jgi:enoyl-CoA hydratase/carnithine racemase
MEYSRLIYEKKDYVATITLSRPDARNAWSQEVNTELLDVFRKMEDDPEVRATILTGDQRGNAFSAGADIRKTTTHAVQPENAGEILGDLYRISSADVFDTVADYSKPLIVAINGYALGIGFLITLCGDILIASENAEMGLPQVGLGVLPAYAGGLRLVRFVGKGNAMKIILTSQRITAQEAYRIGLVSEVVPLPELIPTAERLAGRIASLPPLSTRLAKESVNIGMDIGSLKQAGRADLYRFFALGLTEDRLEGHSAWREKRKPLFKGK